MSDSIDWDAGDEVLLSSSKHHGAGGHGDASSPAKVYASHIIRDVSKDGRTLYLDTALTQDYVGEVVMIDAVENGTAVSKAVDVRAVVALRRWNVRILGADTNKYDRVAGLTSWQTGWGASVRALGRRTAAKPGWSAYMPLYEEMGTEQLPRGHITIKHGARFERCGKGFFEGVAEDMASWDGVAAIPCLIYSSEQEHVEFVGAHAVTPFDGASKSVWGNFFGEGAPPSADTLSGTVSFRWNVFVGENFAFAGGHTVEDNVFLGGAEGCPVGLCPGASPRAPRRRRRRALIFEELRPGRHVGRRRHLRPQMFWVFFIRRQRRRRVVGRVSDPGRGLQLPRPQGPPELRWVDRGY